MKRGADIPDSDHVMRHVSRNRLRRDGEGNVIGFLPQAFALRDGEKALSVNWIEYFQGSWDVKIEQSVHLFRQIREIKNSCAFAVGNVDKIKITAQQNSVSIRIAFAPTSSIPNHVEIHRIPQDEISLLNALAEDAFTDIVFNSNIT